MYVPTTPKQLFSHLEQAMNSNLGGTGFGQFRLDCQPNCRHARQILLHNTCSQGFELSGPSVEVLLKAGLVPSSISSSLLPIWRPLYQKLAQILSSQGHGNFVVEFERIKNNRFAVVTLRGGPSQRVQLPVDQTWL